MLKKQIIWLAVCLCMRVITGAQVCNGSFGDPVAQITFGDGGNVGNPLPPPVVPTTYSYVSADCPNDGQYSIRARTLNCYSQTWYSVSEDHTPGDGSGHFMLVNGALQPGAFFVDTMKNLCPNVTYEFSMWILNVLKPGFCSGSSILPDISIRIETPTGSNIAIYNIGTIPELERASWRQHTLVFNIPSGTNSIVVRLIDNAKGGCGNEFAIDDIAVRPCGSLLQANITNNNALSINVCDGDKSPIILNTAFGGTFINPGYQWQVSNDFGATWADIPGATAKTCVRPLTGVGTYQYRMTITENNNGNNAQCRVPSNIILVSVSSLPNANITNYVYGCYGSTVILFAAGGNDYRWTGPNGFTSNMQQPSIPNVQFTDAGKYKVFVTDHRGCSSSDSMILDIYPAVNATRGPDVSFCEADSSIIAVGGGVRYKWIPATGLSNDTIATPYAKPKETTLYKGIAYSEYGCSDTVNINVVVWNKPVANAGPDKRMRQGFGVALEGSIKGEDYSYSWAPPAFMDNAANLHPKVSPPQDMEYELKAISNKGCGSTSDKVKIKVYDKVIVPNAFSPNGDGINDTWLIEPLDLFDGAEVFVYDRYGRIAFHSKGSFKPWDGKRNGNPVPVGTYYYSIDLKIASQPKIIGTITIVR